MKKLIFLIFLILNFYNIVNGINILSKNVENKNTSIMGVDINYALYDIEFDDDLYSYKGIGCPLIKNGYGGINKIIEFNDIDNENNQCVCDYTIKNYDIIQCNQKCSLPIKDQLIENWNVLKINNYSTSNIIDISGSSNSGQLNYFNGSGGELNFRFLNLKEKLGFFLKITPISGNFETNFYSSLQEFGINESFNSLDGEILINICPDESTQTNIGTYFLNVVPLTSNISFSIQLQYINIPVIIDNQTYTNSCIEILPQSTTQNGITCLLLGKLFNTLETAFYTFQVPEPGYYVFNLKSEDSYLFISDDSSININNLNEDNSKWYIKNFGKSNNLNSITIYFEKPINLYIKALCDSFQCGLGEFNFYIIKSQVLLKKMISLMNPLEGSLALVSTSRLKLNNHYFNCQKYSSCNPFSILYATNDITSLWPVPSALQSTPSFDYKMITINNIQQTITKSKSYQFSIILSINYGKGIIENFNLQDAINSIEIEFLSNIFDSNGNAINLKVNNFNYKLINDCNFNQFKNSVNQINNIKDEYDLGLEEINNLKYEIGIVKSMDNWIACENKALSYLEFENYNKTSPSYQCPYSSKSDPAYELDPCCNYHLLFSKACTMKPIQIETLAILDFKDDNITEQCFNLDCTSIVLYNFANEKYSFLGSDDGDDIDGCKVSTLDVLNTQLSTYSALRECKDQVLTPPTCNNDNDCKEFSNSTRKCDLFTRKCMVNYEITDKKYIRCVLESLPASTLYSFISTLDIDSEIIDSIYDSLKYQDWVIEGSYPKHSTYTYGLFKYNNELSMKFDLIDYSNEIVYTKENEIRGWEFIEDDYYYSHLMNKEKLNCEAYFKMLPRGYNSGVYSYYLYNCPDMNSNSNKVVDQLVTSHDFCGYCTDNSNDDNYCHIYNGSLVHLGLTSYSSDYPFNQSDATIDKAQCTLGLAMCILKDGEYLPSISKNDCENNRGTCSEPCGYQCEGVVETCIWLTFDNTSDIDYITMDQLTCEDNGFTWVSYETTDACVTGDTNEQSCKDNGYIWLDCKSNQPDNCIGPNFNLVQADDERYLDNFRGLCKLKEIPCTTKEECLNRGRCSDYHYFYDQPSKEDNEDIYPYPNGLGKCVRNHTIDTVYGKSCDFTNEYESPNGCFSVFDIPGKEVCSAKGSQYKWWKPSTNKQECESQMGCKTIDYIYNNNLENLNPNNLPYNYKFNEMDQENCQAQYLSGNQWVSKFQWKQAEWYPGIQVSSQWYQNKSFVNRYHYKDVFDYQSFFIQLNEATQKQVSILYSSETACQNEKSVKYLNSVLCSCNGDGNSECFNSTNQILDQSIKCSGEISTLYYSDDEITFAMSYNESSIDKGCEMVSISQISRSTFSVSSPQPLSNNFISYINPDNFAVLNSNDAIIGTLLGDGIIIKSQYGIDSVKLCISIKESSKSSKYPILDFAIKENNKLHPINSIPVDYESNEFLSSSSSDSGGESKKVYYCSIITDLSNITTIYPMNRIEDWEDQDKKVLDKKTEVLVYILACFFSLVGIYGLVQIIEFLVDKFKNSTPFQLTHLLIASVTSFILIRGVYFFVLPSGSLSDTPASDYLLVVLPTFIYLSSFSIIIALWYIIVFIVLKCNTKAVDMRSRLFTIVSCINSIIYLFFVAIVIAFQYTPFEPMTDCITLIFEEMKNSRAQEIVSIVYSVVQAFLSLLIGISFIYLGSSIISAMKNKNLTGGIYSNNQIKIKALTVICSVGFILHCIFIILISVKAVQSIIFTFIGLTVTEIIPAISILLAFDQRFSSSSKPKSSNESKGDVKLNTVSTDSLTPTGTELGH